MPTLRQLHLHELHRLYMAAHRRAMEALAAGDLEAFGDAIRQKRAILDERLAALRDYAEQCHKRDRSLRERLQRLAQAKSGMLDASADADG